MSRFFISTAPVDPAILRDELHLEEAGGFCAFEGWVRNRNDGRDVDGLDYESYAPLATAEGERILTEAMAHFDISNTIAVHRVGSLKIGDIAVWIGVSAPHRDAAFRACRYIIDEIKLRVPVWKRERYREGDTTWIACHQETSGS